MTDVRTGRESDEEKYKKDGYMETNVINKKQKENLRRLEKDKK